MADRGYHPRSRFDDPFPRNSSAPRYQDSRDSRYHDYRRSRSPGFDSRTRSRSPMGGHSSRHWSTGRDDHRPGYPAGHSGGRPSSPPRRSYSPSRQLQAPSSSWRNHDVKSVLDGTIKEYIDDFTGLMEVELNGELLTAFFHATVIWVVNPDGNPYGEPVKFTDVLGKNTATTRENKNISLYNEAPLGSEVLIQAMPVQSDVVQLVILSAWPKSTEPPPQPRTEHETKMHEKKQEYFLKEFHNKVENQASVEASFPGCIPALYPNLKAHIWEIKDDDFGIIEIKGEMPRCRFLALFHKTDVFLRDGKQGCKVEFFKHKPLQEMCRVGQPVNLIARSILVTKGSELTPGVMELQAVVVSLNPDRIPPKACRPTWCPGRPGVFGEPTKHCRFFRGQLYEELNIKLKNFIIATRKNLPNLDLNFFDGKSPLALLNPVQIKQERFEEYQNQQERIAIKKEAFENFQNQSLAPELPKIMQGVTGVIFQHVGSMGRDMVIVEDLNKTWRCLAFKENTIYPGGVADMKIAFPSGSQVTLNAELANPEKSIQYIATMICKPMNYTPGRDFPLNDEHYMKYYEVLKTIGKVLDTVAKLPLGKPVAVSTDGQLICKVGVVRKILDDNFGLIQIQEGLALFDTCDYWVAPKTSAAKMNKKLEEVVSVGTNVAFHACLIDPNAKINFLATAVWLEHNSAMKIPTNMPVAIKREEINATKIDIYSKVVVSVADTLTDIVPQKPVAVPIDPVNVLPWEHAVIKAIVYDKSRKLNGGILAGAARISNSNSFGFFLTKHFVKIDAVPSVGMEEFVTLYPVSKLENRNVFGSFEFIILALYPTFMGAGSVGRKDAFQIQTIIQECQQTLMMVLDKYPGFQDPGNYMRICENSRMNVNMLQIDTAQASNKIQQQPPSQQQMQVQVKVDMSRPPPQMVAPPVGVPAPVEAPPSQVSDMAPTISVNAAFLRCMFNNNSGVLMSERDHPPKMCYFEIHDLNLEQPVDLLDMVMLLNRMDGIKVHFQARLIDEKAPIPYVAHSAGVQIVGQVPSYMPKVRLRNSMKPTQIAMHHEKIKNYKKAVDMFQKGHFQTISELLSHGKKAKNFANRKGVVVSILNENFGLVEIMGVFALFDTFDLYISQSTTAAEANKTIEDCVSVGKEMMVNACLIDETLPITHLATSLHAKDRADIKNEAALSKDEIQKSKIEVYTQVATNCESVIDTLMAKKDTKLRDINKVYHYEAYRHYVKVCPKESRKPSDPMTPSLDMPVTSRAWSRRITEWTNGVNTWYSNFKRSSNLLKEPSIRDYEAYCEVIQEINDKFAIVKFRPGSVKDGEKAFIHVTRLWIFKQPIFGGWKALQRIGSKVFNVSARSIEAVSDIKYQVTFAHTGLQSLRGRDRKFQYSREMEEWIDKIVTMEKMNDELQEFKYVYSPTLSNYKS